MGKERKKNDMPDEEILKNFIKKLRQRKMTEEEFFDNFYTLKQEVSIFFSFVNLKTTIMKNINLVSDNIGGFFDIEISDITDYKEDSYPDNLIDYINPNINPWAAPENRSDALKLFLKLNDDSVKNQR